MFLCPRWETRPFSVWKSWPLEHLEGSGTLSFHSDGRSVVQDHPSFSLPLLARGEKINTSFFPAERKCAEIQRTDRRRSRWPLTLLSSHLFWMKKHNNGPSFNVFISGIYSSRMDFFSWETRIFPFIIWWEKNSTTKDSTGIIPRDLLLFMDSS